MSTDISDDKETIKALYIEYLKVSKEVKELTEEIKQKELFQLMTEKALAVYTQ